MIRAVERVSHIATLRRLALTGAVVSFLFQAQADGQSAGAKLTEIPRGALQAPSTVKTNADLDGILAERTLRVLVVPNRTNYFVDRGIQRGLTYDSFTQFGSFLERIYKQKLRLQTNPSSKKSMAVKLGVVFVPVHRDEIFQALTEGRGDVAAASLTVTDSRSQLVNFTQPLFSDVNEIIVSGPGAPPLRVLDDLAGQTVHVRRATSYYESLTALNARLQDAGKAPMHLALLPDEIENEDKLEMLNAGLIKLAVIEAPLFDFWKTVFPAIKSHPDLVVRKGGSIAWAVRKENPQLLAALNQFLATDYRHDSPARAATLSRYLKSARWAKPVQGGAALQRYNQTVELFRRYSAQYGFDHLLVLAQGFQESQLDQSAVSPVGAIGLMQVMPATGQEMGVGDINMPGPNVHAGTRYLRRVIDTYFGEPQLTTLNRMMFAFASYNAGPNRVNRLRDEAKKLGLDRDVWFGNVELVVADRVGREPVQYVGNILKYYVAYTHIEEVALARDAAKKNSK